MNDMKHTSKLALFTIFALFLCLQISILSAVTAAADDPPGWSVQYSSAEMRLFGISAVDANTCWASGCLTVDDATIADGMVLKTTNGGTKWEEKNTGIVAVLSDVAAVDANTCWAVGYKQNGEEGVILKTTNGGDNWSIKTISGHPFTAVDAVDANTCWAGGVTNIAEMTSGFVYRTTNGGTNWQESNPDMPYLITSLSAVDANTCWIAALGSLTAPTQGALAKTTNGGLVWERKIPDDQACFSVCALDQQVVWYVSIYTEGETGESACYRSLDGGDTWNCSEIIYNPLVPFFFLGDAFSAVSASTAWIGSFESPDKSSICKTTDANVSWNKQVEYPNIGGKMHYLNGISAADVQNAWAISLGTPDGPPGSDIGSTIYHTSNGGWNEDYSAPKVNSITPSSGNPNTVVSITNLAGSNFQAGATVWLERSGTIINATGVSVSPTMITCQFDLSGAPSGAYDVVVRNPEGTDGRLPGGFTVNTAKPCGLGGGLSFLLFGTVMGLFSLVGSGALSRRRRRGTQ